MKIVRARLKPFSGSAEFVSVEGRIKSLIEKNKEDIFHFVVDEDGVKTVKEFGLGHGRCPDNINPELVNQTIAIGRGPYHAKFNEDGTIDVVNEVEPLEESIFSRKSDEDKIALQFIDRLKKIKKSDKVCNIQELEGNEPDWFNIEEDEDYYVKQGYIIKFEDVDMIIVSYTFDIHWKRTYLYLGNNISNMCEEVKAKKSYLDKIFYLAISLCEDKERKKRVGNLYSEINPVAEPLDESIFSRKTDDDKLTIQFIDRLKKFKNIGKPECKIEKYNNPPQWFNVDLTDDTYHNQGYVIKFEDVDLIIISFVKFYIGKNYADASKFYKFYVGNDISGLCEEIKSDKSYCEKLHSLAMRIYNSAENKKRLNKIETEVNPAAGMVDESLPRERSVKQLKKLRKLTRGTDIGDRISDMNKQGANIQYIQNPIDTGVESYEDFEKHNKKFIPSWNLKHLLSPYGNKSKKK